MCLFKSKGEKNQYKTSLNIYSQYIKQLHTNKLRIHNIKGFGHVRRSRIFLIDYKPIKILPFLIILINKILIKRLT